MRNKSFMKLHVKGLNWTPQQFQFHVYLCGFTFVTKITRMNSILTIPTKIKHALTRIQIFTDHIFSFLKMSTWNNSCSIKGFGRRTMKNARHLMWRVVNYDQLKFSLFFTTTKSVTLLKLYKREPCHAHANFHYLKM